MPNIKSSVSKDKANYGASGENETVSANIRFMKNLRWIFLILVVAILMGCQKNPADLLIGDWKVDTSSLKTTNMNPQMSDIIKSGSLHFSKDKSFALTFQQSVTGTYQVNDLTVTMKSTAISGQPIEKLEAIDQRIGKLASITATLSPDGKSLMVSSFGQSTRFIKSTP